MAIPSLAMIPSGYKDGKVYSVLPSNGDGDFTFSRGSSATRVNKDGLIEVLAFDIPRLDYSDGSCPSLLLEGQSTNLLPYSNEFTNAAWSKSSTGINTSVGTNGINENIAISPDGTQNADRVNFNLQSDLDSGMFDIFAASQNNTYSTSVYLKGEGSNIGKKVSIRVKRSSGGAFTSVDTDYTLTNEWVRLEIYPLTLPSGATNGIIAFSSSEATSCLIYGAQIEEQSHSTSYIPTNGAVATRLADECNSAGNASTFNDSEGVLMVETSALANDGTFRTIAINGTPTNVNEDRIQIYFRTDANIINFGMESGDSAQFFLQFPLDVKSNNKLALKYSASSCSFWINGFEVGEELNKVMPTGLSRLDFNLQNGGDNFYGKTKQVQYFNTALTDIEIEELSSWSSFLEMAEGQQYKIK